MGWRQRPNSPQSVDPNIHMILRHGRLGVEPGGLVKLRIPMLFEARHYGRDYVDVPSAQFEDANSLAAMFDDIASIFKLTGANVDIIRCRNVSKIEALEGEHLRWCDELAMNRVLRVREEIIAHGVPESACMARVVEGAQEDVLIRFSTDEGKSLLSAWAGFHDGPRVRDQHRTRDNHTSPDGEMEFDRAISVGRNGVDATMRRNRSAKKSAKKESGEKPAKAKGKAKAKAKSKGKR